MNTNNGWKLVPVEPTEEMEAAAVGDYEQSGGTYRKSAYAAMLAAAPAAPGSPASTVVDEGEKDERAPEWVTCESRRPWVSNSLKANAQELRDKERRCRTAYNKDFYGIPARYVADAYAEAASVFEAKLAAISASQQGGE